MTNCRDSAKQVSYAAPPYTHIFRNGPMFCDEIWEFLMYVFSPIDVIAIRRVGQPWKERELQVIVRVDQAGHEQKPAEVNLRTVGCGSGR